MSGMCVCRSRGYVVGMHLLTHVIATHRVPIDDGKRMQWALKARADAPPVRTIVFEEDNHALERPQTEAEQFFNTAWWLAQYLK